MQCHKLNFMHVAIYELLLLFNIVMWFPQDPLIAGALYAIPNYFDIPVSEHRNNRNMYNEHHGHEPETYNEHHGHEPETGLVPHLQMKRLLYLPWMKMKRSHQESMEEDHWRDPHTRRDNHRSSSSSLNGKALLQQITPAEGVITKGWLNSRTPTREEYKSYTVQVHPSAYKHMEGLQENFRRYSRALLKETTATETHDLSVMIEPTDSNPNEQTKGMKKEK